MLGFLHPIVMCLLVQLERYAVQARIWDQPEQAASTRINARYKCLYRLIVCLFGDGKKYCIVFVENAFFLEHGDNKLA